MEIIEVSGTARRRQNEYIDTVKSKKRRRAFPLTTLSRIDLKFFVHFISVSIGLPGARKNPQSGPGGLKKILLPRRF